MSTTTAIIFLSAAILGLIGATAACGFGLGLIAATSRGRRVRQAGPLRAAAPDPASVPGGAGAVRPGDHATGGELGDIERIAAMSASDRYDALVWLAYIAPDAFARAFAMLAPIDQ
jgi:hypothetical protein